MTVELDKATRLAMDSHIPETLGQRVERWIKSAPPAYKALATVFLCLALGGLAALVWWEGNNAGQGFQMLGKGIAAPWIAYLAGFGCTVGCIAFFRVTMETIRDNSVLSRKVMFPAIAALVFGLLSAAGTFANLIDNATANQSLSKTQSADRAVLLADYRTLKARVDGFDTIQMTAMVEADNTALKAMLAEATGWGMPNLDAVAPEDAAESYPGPACAADLKPRQRQLCNAVNGPDGLLSSISQGEAALASHAKAVETLDIARRALDVAPEAENAQFWDVASETFSEATHGEASTQGPATGNAFMVIMMLVLTIGILLGTCFGCEAIFEHLETRAERKAKTKALG
jgi:hypothetical protein